MDTSLPVLPPGTPRGGRIPREEGSQGGANLERGAGGSGGRPPPTHPAGGLQIPGLAGGRGREGRGAPGSSSRGPGGARRALAVGCAVRSAHLSFLAAPRLPLTPHGSAFPPSLSSSLWLRLRTALLPSPPLGFNAFQAPGNELPAAPTLSSLDFVSPGWTHCRSL